MKKNKLFILVIFIFIFVFLSSCDNTTNSDVTSNVNNQYTTNNNINDTFYTIIFENYDGNILETVKVKKGEVPYYSKGTPTRDEDELYSYTFTGWYPNIIAATTDQYYVAQYKKIDLPTFTVTFDANGGDFDGESMITYTVKKNNKIASPTSPTNKNYDFAGWTTSKNATTLWDFSSDIVNKNITLYAKWEEKEAVIMSVENSTIADDQIYMVVDKDTEYVSLSNRVISSKNSSWKLYRDRLGQTEIPTKICGTLVDGDNNFYIVVTSANGSQTNTYELVIHRSHLVSIKFIDDYTVLKTEYVDSGYEYVIDYIPTFEGCTFESWLLNGYKVTSFILKDYTELEVLKTPNKYKITLDVNGGNALSSNEYEAIYYKYVNLPIPTRTGYTFLGWEYNGELLTDETGTVLYTYTKDISVNAKWKINEYTVTLKVNNEKAGSVADAKEYIYGLVCDSVITITAEYDSKVEIIAITNSGYTFNGWYLNNLLYEEEASFDYIITSLDVSFEARFTINKYTITLDNQAEDVTISGIVSGNKYEYDTQIMLTAMNIPDGYTIKWSRSDGIIFADDIYLFNVPSANITITINVCLYKMKDNKIYFGTYPQKKVEATTENGLSSIMFDTSTWISYKYYISYKQTDFMYYKDVDIDNNGTYDYRGVYFTQYRPSIFKEPSSTTFSYQDDNGYAIGKIYWFSYDLIEWNILKEDSGKALVIANLILDSQDFYRGTGDNTSQFNHNDGTGYANNYELSNIRKFLNDNFYNTAFNDLQKTLIEETTVDNSASSTGYSSNSYACNNTKDKLFLLSYSEATSSAYGLNSNSARQAKGSDYAKCQGLYVYSSTGYSCWWLRSPDYQYAYYAYFVNDEGKVDNYYGTVGIAYRGVRPAFWINL